MLVEGILLHTMTIFSRRNAGAKDLILHPDLQIEKPVKIVNPDDAKELNMTGRVDYALFQFDTNRRMRGKYSTSLHC